MEANNAVNTEYDELAAPHGEIVVLIARGVGLLVALAAVLFAILFMMVIRALIVIVLYTVGVSGVCVLVGAAVYCIMKWKGVSANLIVRILSRSCN